ncbi:MAG: LytTR family DNA-binding domain-containing protein [Bacteroidota bacterium]
MKKTPVYERGGFRLFSPQDVVCLKDEDRYTRFFVRHKYLPQQLYDCHLYALTLGHFEETFHPETFQRINRQTIINLYYMEAWGPKTKLSWTLTHR